MGYSDNSLISSSSNDVQQLAEAYDHTVEWFITIIIVIINLFVGLVVNHFFPGLRDLLLKIVPSTIRPYVAPFIIVAAVILFALIQPRILRTLNLAEVARRTIQRQRQIEHELIRLQRENIQLREITSQHEVDCELQQETDSYKSCEE